MASLTGFADAGAVGDGIRVATADLIDFTAVICAATGSAAAEARTVATHLVEGNLRGHDSHGVVMLPLYVDAVLDGRAFPNRALATVSDRGAVLVFDGGRGYGQVQGSAAMRHGIERARRDGAVVVALRNCHHLGRIGAYAEQCAAAGLASMHYVNVTGHFPIVAPFGGGDSRLATNPFCAAVPRANGEPVVLDMATSRVALGKVRVAMHRGAQVDPGTLINGQGQPTTDPATMFSQPRGALLPFGEHKGAGLALICELFAGALTGGRTIQPKNQHDDTMLNNMLSVIVDPAALGDSGSFAAEVDAMIAYVKASPPRAAGEAVLIAGEPERLIRGERLAKGIPIDRQSWQQIVDAARRAGVGDSAVPATSSLQ